MSGARPSYDVVVTVAGLAQGSGVLTIEVAGASTVRTADSRCTAVHTVVTCQVPGDSSFAVEVVAPRGSQVVAVLAHAGADADAGNNIWRATLG